MDDVLSRLSRLLERERSALAGGQLSELAELTREKEALARHLAATPTTTDDGTLAALARRADENGRMLGAARAGLNAARERLAGIRAAGEVETYDAGGRRRRHGPPPRSLLRRA